jgi:hypothetical protein
MIAVKLGNCRFLSGAKPEVVKDQPKREADASFDRDRLAAIKLGVGRPRPVSSAGFLFVLHYRT